MADPVTLHIEPAMIGAIDELARQANQPRDVLVEEALQNFVKLRAWQIAKIEAGIAAADRGEFASDEEMERISPSTIRHEDRLDRAPPPATSRKSATT